MPAESEAGAGGGLWSHQLRLVTAEKHVMETLSEITCPECGHAEVETMPVDAYQWSYDCKGCGALLKPKSGDCCVYCSYGSIACPPVQQGNGCCASDSA
jgi:hypothetical protein